MLKQTSNNYSYRKTAENTNYRSNTELKRVYNLERQNKEYKELVLNLLKTLKEVQEPDRCDENCVNYHKDWSEQLEIVTIYMQKRIELFLLREDI